MSYLLPISLLTSLLTVCYSRSAIEWKSRTIYQILTDRFAAPNSLTSCKDLSNYCGGNYQSLVDHLDYIEGMGFDAIWISPFLLNKGSDYHGYAFLDLYQINPHFGTEADLKKFISTAHARGIWVMLDVVGNHVAPVDLDFSQINPFNESQYYHTKCQIEDWDDQGQVEYCRLANLPDLDQDNSFVRRTLLDWVGSLKGSYDFDGLRIDTIPEVKSDFWEEFSSEAGMYTVGEVFNGDLDYVSSYQKYMDGVLSYPLYFTMRNVFAYKQSMYEIEDMMGPSGSMRSAYENLDYLGTFIDNHDNSRFLFSQSSYTLYKNAIAMTLFTQGIPIIYYGTEQGYNGGDDPKNRESLWPNYNTEHELYQFIATLVHARQEHRVYTEEQVQRYVSSNFYAFSRGYVLVCLTNAGDNSNVNVVVNYLPYAVGDVVCNVLDDSDCLTVSIAGISVTMSNGQPKVYLPK